MNQYVKIVLLIYAVMSFTAFLFYGIDKRKAQKHKWRIKESVLLSLSFFGGAVGATLGMLLFRHKTKHWYFWLVAVLGLAWQAGLLVYLLIK